MGVGGFAYKKKTSVTYMSMVKYRANGSLERYKEKLMAKGYTQTYDVDYLETFASVAKMKVIRILLSLTTNYN